MRNRPETGGFPAVTAAFRALELGAGGVVTVELRSRMNRASCAVAWRRQLNATTKPAIHPRRSMS